jgi:excisionase family DNA binding protein
MRGEYGVLVDMEMLLRSEVAPGQQAAAEAVVDVRAAANFLGVSPSLVYAYVERRQIPHFRMMGRSIRFRLSELAEWRQQFHVNGGSSE